MPTCPYYFHIQLMDGTTVEISAYTSLHASVEAVRDMFAQSPAVYQSAEIVDNYTGEVVYTLSTKIIIDLEEDNPYNI